MSRIEQPQGARGSLKWIQRACNESWPEFERSILAQLTGAQCIDWRSPLKSDGYAEYRDADFLDQVGLSHLAGDLHAYWPARGPQWDALGRTDRNDVLLVEAKAHIGEMCSPATAAGPRSRQLIEQRLDEVAGRLGAREGHAPWAGHFYQLGNRLAHLAFLRDRNVPAYLVLVNFLNDTDMKGPTTAEVWQAAYEVAFHVMGLGRRHDLSRYVLEVFPDVVVRQQTLVAHLSLETQSATQISNNAADTISK